MEITILHFDGTGGKERGLGKFFSEFPLFDLILVNGLHRNIIEDRSLHLTTDLGIGPGSWDCLKK